MTLIRISMPERELWALLSNNDNISLFDDSPDNIPDVLSEIILEPSNDNYSHIRGEMEGVLEGEEENRVIYLSFENIFLASDVYLQERIFTRKGKTGDMREPHAYIAKMEDNSFKALAEAGMMRHLELLFVSLLEGELREKHNYVVSNAVDARYHQDRNSVELISPNEEFESIFVDAYQARLILDKIA